MYAAEIHKHAHIIYITYVARMFLSVIFIISPNWKQPKCLSTAEWIKNTVAMFVH